MGVQLRWYESVSWHTRSLIHSCTCAQARACVRARTYTHTSINKTMGWARENSMKEIKCKWYLKQFKTIQRAKCHLFTAKTYCEIDKPLVCQVKRKTKITNTWMKGSSAGIHKESEISQQFIQDGYEKKGVSVQKRKWWPEQSPKWWDSLTCNHLMTENAHCA